MLSLFGLSKLYIRAFYALICYHTFWNEDYLYGIKWLVGGNFVNLSLCPHLKLEAFFNRWSLRPSAHQCVHPTITRMTDRSTNWPPVRPSARPKGYPGIFSLKYGMLMCPVYLQSSLYIFCTRSVDSPYFGATLTECKWPYLRILGTFWGTHVIECQRGSGAIFPNQWCNSKRNDWNKSNQYLQ